MTQEVKDEVRALFQTMVGIQVESAGVQAVLNNFREYEDERLRALDYPALPLHNNASEQDSRDMVKFRKVSGSTKSTEGRSFRDSLLTLKHMCRRLSLSHWEFSRSWFWGSVSPSRIAFVRATKRNRSLQQAHLPEYLPNPNGVTFPLYLLTLLLASIVVG